MKQRSVWSGLIVTGLIVTGLIVLMSLSMSMVTGQTEPEPAVTILSVNGEIEFIRVDWRDVQPLLPGTDVRVNDLIFPDEATLTVMCPDGRPRQFGADELFNNDVIQCPSETDEYVVGATGLQRINVQRGGRQDASIPYLIAPRSTAVRTPSVDLVWNHVSDASDYELTVRSDASVVWESGTLDAETVVMDNQAQVALPLELIPDVPYTVEICVTLANGQSGCTTDPGWSTGDSLAFFYHPETIISDREQSLMQVTGDDAPTALFARAILLSQPIPALSEDDDPVAYYQEAIDLIEELVNDYPEASLSQSPHLWLKLGELYLRVALPRNAASAFEQAIALAPPQTEVFARANYGQALTGQTDDTVELYNQALTSYAAFLQDDAFQDVFRLLCRNMGEICLDLDLCEDDIDACLDIILETDDE